MINSPVINIQQNQSTKHNLLQDVQYSLYSSYIKYASEKLAVRQADIIAKTSAFLQKMQMHSDQKQLTDLCTTEASLYNAYGQDEKSLLNSNERKTAFKRKRKYKNESNNKSSVAEALQEIKEVCSQKTVAMIQQIFADYQKFTEQQHILDFRLEVLTRETKFKKNRDKCQNCLQKIQVVERRLVQNEQIIIRLNLDNQKLSIKIGQLQNKLKQKQAKSQLNSTISSTSYTYEELLSDKQKVVQSRCKQLKSIEITISSSIQTVVQLTGCKRCEIIHQIKKQIIDYRKHYQKQFEVLAKLLAKYRKVHK